MNIWVFSQEANGAPTSGTLELLTKVVNLRIEEAGGSGSEAIESAQRLYVQDRLRVVVGRDAAIESTVAKLAQSQNVVLYGPPGSGASGPSGD